MMDLQSATADSVDHGTHLALVRRAVIQKIGATGMPEWVGVDPGRDSSWTGWKHHFIDAQLLDAFPGAWRRILENVIANAVDSLGEGDTVIVSTELDAAEELTGRVTVACGMSEAETANLFYTTKPAGTGLGHEPYVTQRAAKHVNKLGLADWIEPIVSLVRQSVPVQQVRVDWSPDEEDPELSTLVIKLAFRGTAQDVVQVEKVVNDALFERIPADVRLHFAFDYIVT